MLAAVAMRYPVCRWPRMCAARLALVRGVTLWPSPQLGFGIEMQNGASDRKLIVRSCGCYDVAAVSP